MAGFKPFCKLKVKKIKNLSDTFEVSDKSAFNFVLTFLKLILKKNRSFCIPIFNLKL